MPQSCHIERVTAAANIISMAHELGFDLAGIAPAVRSPTADQFFQWLENGHHGNMQWLDKGERRADPSLVLEHARSIIVVGKSYYTQDPPDDVWKDPLRGRIARYAWGPDYHDVITPTLAQLSGFIRDKHPAENCRYYVDTGPVLERSFAALAGLGFVGKNTLIISPAHGSYIFLGVILTTLELEPSQGADPPSELLFQTAEGHVKLGSCGSCTRCQTICPTHAFPAPFILDSRKCISYLTIELKESIPVDLRPLMGSWIYGCDACQEVCPWVHRIAEPGSHAFLSWDPDRYAPRLTDLLQLDQDGFRRKFKGTPMKRTKRRGLLRNAAVALGNSGDPSVKPALENALHDEEPLVREHAAWALDRL